MKKYVLGTALLGLAFGLQAQSVVLTAGGEGSGTGGTLSSSIGQVFYQVASGTNSGTASEGVQQAYQVIVAATTGVLKENQSIKVYPNPVRKRLTIDLVDFDNLEGTRLHLYNMLGQEVKTKGLNAATTELDLGYLAVGSYMLRIEQAGKLLKTYKLIKSEH